MNLVKNYWEAQRLSKMMLQEARIRHGKGRDHEAVGYVIQALTNLMAGTSCFSTLMFTPRKKVRSKRK